MTSIPRDSSHKPKGMCFVRFNRKSDALNVVDKYATLLVNGETLECSKYDSNVSKVISESANFRNIPEGLGDHELLKLFEEFGIVKDIRINKENNSGIVYFSSSGSVQKAVQALNGKSMAENNVFYITQNEDQSKRAKQYNNLYVGNVDRRVTEAEIREVFSKFGEIESILLPTFKGKGENGEFNKDVRKSHVYISFKESKSASDAIKEMDSREKWGRPLNVDFYTDFDTRKKTMDRSAGYKNSRDGNSYNMSQGNSNLVQEFTAAMMNVMSQFSAMNMRGRGGHSGPSSGYRGNNSYRGSRGGNRGGTRGNRGRGSMRGGTYNVRSQYEHPKTMMPNAMGLPPMGSMGHGMGGMPPMGQLPMSQPPMSQPPMSQPPMSQLPMSQPPMSQPPMSQPPMSQPPMTQPPMSQPPMSQPPMTQPPMSQPPMSQPPMSQPPMSQPPMSQPPMTQPPMSQPPMSQPPMTTPMATPMFNQPDNALPTPPMQQEELPTQSQELFEPPQIDVLAIPMEQYEQSENEIGTFLYNKIEVSHGSEMAGRIAGMFLDIPPEELYQILHDDDTYKRYITDAEELITNENQASEEINY